MSENLNTDAYKQAKKQGAHERAIPGFGIACATARAHTGYERMNFSVLGMLMK